MKFKFFIFFIVFSIIPSHAQVNTVNSSQILDYVNLLKSTNKSYGGKLLGSVLLFDDWSNKCVIQLNGKQFKLKNVNFNIQNNEFMSEIGKDSIFSIDSKYIDYIVIKDKKFIYHLYNGENKFFESLLETEKKISLFKGYSIRILPKSEMGMLNRPYDEIKKKVKYYVLLNSKLSEIKLKKKEILKFMYKNKQGKVINYIKERRLSFKKEKDLKEIFKYYNSI